MEKCSVQVTFMYLREESFDNLRNCTNTHILINQVHQLKSTRELSKMCRNTLDTETNLPFQNVGHH